MESVDSGDGTILPPPQIFCITGFFRLLEGVFFRSREGGAAAMGFNVVLLSPVLHCPQTKNPVRTTTSNITETGIWPKSAPQNPFGSFNTLRSFTGAVLPTEACT